ncbi:MAG: metallophosphoesterase [Prevotellaceae bacterium]|jgi:predicted MPP superfamily phosphohydrolase|nr:metallophosphoesterase [Prevotellaceae bacterium]
MRWIFFVSIFALYFGANIYLLFRGLHSLPQGMSRIVFATAVCFLALIFLAGMFFENKFPVWITSVIQHIGGTWLISLVYLVPIVLIIDIVCLINKYLPFLPKFLTLNPQTTGLYTFFSVAGLLVIILIFGIVKFNNPSVVKPDFKTSKQLRNSPKIVVASDLHLGYVTGSNKLNDFVELINSQNPDIVLLCGDIFDRSVRPVESKNMLSKLKEIKAPLGVYVVPGNHEYYGDREKAFRYLSETFILLRDSVAQPAEDIYIVGRDDRTNANRKPLSEIMQGIDHNKLIILLDHQPQHLEEAMNAGVDFQFSGHTHDGQVWPVSSIARKLYEKSYGYLKKGNTQYYITSGLGLWGAHLRIGTRSEILVLENYTDINIKQ